VKLTRAVSLGLASMVAIALALSPTMAGARGDKDCADFSSQKAAQIYFLKHGGPRYDPDRLDADHDGKACEDNPAPYYFGTHLP
jgi:Excalibur calcium-binding domain